MSTPLAAVETAPWGPDGVVVRVTGEVDSSNVAEVEARTDAALGRAGTVVLDLSAVGYLDSQGLRWLAALAARLRSAATGLVVVAPPDSVAERVLDLAGLTATLGLRPAVPPAPAGDGPGSG